MAPTLSFDRSCSSVPRVRSSAWLETRPKQYHWRVQPDSGKRCAQTHPVKRAQAMTEVT